MSEERLVESILLKPWPNSYFNWYEKVSKWLGKVTNRYEIIVRNSNVFVTTISNVGENPVNEELRKRILCVCKFINETRLSEVSSNIRSSLIDKKVVDALSLFNGMTLFKTSDWMTTDHMVFKMLLNYGGKTKSINDSEVILS